MKQITKHTILKQITCCTPVGQVKRYIDCKGCDKKPQDKSYPAIELEQGKIVWVENRLPKKNEKYVDYINKQVRVWNMSVKKDALPYCDIIIASNYELDGVPKISLEDEVEKFLKIFYENQEEDRSEAYVFQYAGNVRNAFIDGFKANQAEYTEADIREVIELSKERIYIKHSGNSTEPKYSIDNILQSLNTIKEITVHEKWSVINTI